MNSRIRFPFNTFFLLFMLLLARSAAITKKPYRSTCNKNNVSLQLKARVNANMRLVLLLEMRALEKLKSKLEINIVMEERMLDTGQYFEYGL